MRTYCLFATIAFTAAAGGIDTPAIGFARAADGSIQRVAGVSGTFISASTNHAGIAAAFSDHLGVVKTCTSILLLNADGSTAAESEAPEGGAVLGFDPAGRSAIAWYPSARWMAIYRDGQWNRVPFDPAGAVLAVAIKDNDRVLAVIRGDQLSVVRMRLVDGAIEDVTFLGSSPGPVQLFPDGSLLYPKEGGFLYRAADGIERTLDIPAGVVEFMPMSATWLQARTETGRNLAIRLLPEPRIFELPPPVPVEAQP